MVASILVGPAISLSTATVESVDVSSSGTIIVVSVTVCALARGAMPRVAATSRNVSVFLSRMWSV